MPTYDYECCDCGKKFELFQKMTDEPLTACGSCQGRVRRLVGAGAAVIYKGGGFYTTEYRSEEYKQKARQEQQQSSGAPACPAAATCKEKTCTG